MRMTTSLGPNSAPRATPTPRRFALQQLPHFLHAGQNAAPARKNLGGDPLLLQAQMAQHLQRLHEVDVGRSACGDFFMGSRVKPLGLVHPERRHVGQRTQFHAHTGPSLAPAAGPPLGDRFRRLAV